MMARKRKCWAFMIPYSTHEDGFPQRLSAKLDRLERRGHLVAQEYTCEGPPDQCRRNPDGDYYMLVGSRRDIPAAAQQTGEYTPDQSPWGNMGSFIEEFPDLFGHDGGSIDHGTD